MAKATVLIVDDEQPFVETISKRLQKRDFQVMKAFSGKEALDLLNVNRHIEVIVLDVKMPVMDGMETLKEIRNRHPLMEVIMLTAHATVESAIEGMKQGAFDYLMKPCDMDLLTEKVLSAADKKRSHEEKINMARMKEIIGKPE